MKTLVLCVDRDDDLGVKTGIKGPIIGRDDNIAAAMKLGLADPEDSDVNALLAAVAVYDDLVKQGADAEIATICGDVRVGSASDLVLAQQLDQVLEEVRPARAFLVSDGLEDEAFAPILGSRIRVDHVRRVYVRQAVTLQSWYYQVARGVKNPKIRRKIFVPLGLVLLVFGGIYLSYPGATTALALILAGFYLIAISLPFSSLRDLLDRVGSTYEGIRSSVASGNMSIFFTASSIILVLVGIFFGLDLAGTTTRGFLDQFLSFVIGALWWFVFAVLLFEVGKVVTARLQHKRAPRHVLPVAGAFVALALFVLGNANLIGALIVGWDPSTALPLGYTSIALAVLLAIATGLSFRAPEERPAEDSWRH